MRREALRSALAGYLSRRYGLAKLQDGFEQLAATLDGGELGTEDEQTESRLVDVSTNGETHLLRHREHYEWLRRHWLPGQLQGSPRTIRVLSAGCSTGEEAYSLVATLLPLIRSKPGWDLEVAAYDINEHALATARLGRYSHWSMRGLAPQELADWVRVEGPEVVVADWVKQPVRFFRQNIVEPIRATAPEPQYELILCRNVLLYFHPAAVAQAWRNFQQQLRPEGILLTTSSDPGPGDPSWQLDWHGSVPVYRHSGRGRWLTRPEPVLAARSFKNHRPTPGPQSFRNPSNLKAEALCLEALHCSEAEDHWGAVHKARQAVFLCPEAPFLVYVLGTLLEKAQEFAGAHRRYLWTEALLADLPDHQVLEFAGGLRVNQLKRFLTARKGGRSGYGLNPQAC